MTTLPELSLIKIPFHTGNLSWTIMESSGASLSGTVYVYCDT